MKIGVKTFDSENFLKHFENKADFFEIMAVQKNDYSFLKKFSLPIVIHAEHERFGINSSDISKKEENLKSLNFAIKVANLANSKKIIAHPGSVEKGNPNSSIKNSIDFYREIDDERILIENVSDEGTLPNFIRLCRTAKEAKKFIKETRKGFCFDVNHALYNIKKSTEITVL